MSSQSTCENERPQPPAEAFPPVGRCLPEILEHPTADINATRPEIGPHGPPAASADVEPTEVVMTVMTPVTAMPVAMTMATVHAVTTMATMPAMPTTVATVTTSRSGGDGSSGQSERGSSCESDFAKHTCTFHLLGVIA